MNQYKTDYTEGGYLVERGQAQAVAQLLDGWLPAGNDPASMVAEPTCFSDDPDQEWVIRFYGADEGGLLATVYDAQIEEGRHAGRIGRSNRMDRVVGAGALSDQQLDDYLCHVLAMFLEWVVEGNPKRSTNWDIAPEHERRIWALALSTQFMALYNECRLEVEKEIA